MNYNDRLDIFKSSCGMYLQDKMILEKANNSTESNDPVKKQYMEYVDQNISYVETSLNQIRNQCGTAAVLLIYLLFIKGYTQTAIAEKSHISRRKLQYSENHFLHVFLDENNKENKLPDQKDIFYAFRFSCQLYKRGKELLNENDLPAESDYDKKMFIKLMSDDIHFTTGVLSAIRKDYGTEAEEIICCLYVEGKNQNDTAMQYHMTRRQLQWNVNKWLNHVLTIENWAQFIKEIDS